MTDDYGRTLRDPKRPVIFQASVPRLALGNRLLNFNGRRRRSNMLISLRGQWTSSALAVRLAQLAAGALVIMLLPRYPGFPVAILALGLLLAIVNPARAGQLLADAGAIFAWVVGYPEHGSPPVAHVLAFAFALYALHDSTSLAATVPMVADLRREALYGWLRRSGLALLVAGVLTLVVYGVGALVNFHTGYLLQVAGLFGIVATVGVAAWLFSRSLKD